jgi:Zn-dependent protease
MGMDKVVLGAIWYVVFLISVTLHEAAHGLAAMFFGDRTAYHHGLVSIDPLPHIRRSPFGMVIVPILSFILGGWMIGWASTPYDPFWARSNRRKAALMALAGPISNLLLVLAAAAAIRAGVFAGIFYAPEHVTFNQVTASASAGTEAFAAILISILFTLNLVLLIFNLIPLPPLDGSNLLLLFLNERTAERYEALLYHPTYMIVGLVIAWQVFGPVFGWVHLLALNILYPGAGYY